jgi:hypothetical protein
MPAAEVRLVLPLLCCEEQPIDMTVCSAPLPIVGWRWCCSLCLPWQMQAYRSACRVPTWSR